MTDLKPCPFCGEKPRVVEDNSYGQHHIFCVCDAEPFIGDALSVPMEELAAKWNRRAHDASETAALRKVRGGGKEVRRTVKAWGALYPRGSLGVVALSKRTLLSAYLANPVFKMIHVTVTYDDDRKAKRKGK
jgi:hypothetical protein